MNLYSNAHKHLNFRAFIYALFLMEILYIYYIFITVQQSKDYNAQV